ncbi:MAG: sigma-70 family RNA polymerase sigma factor [Acidobacteriia bacterium]|nr:sigma-70 family RNA polymerase sigma factor [Terriglobia bacterium]
MSPPSTHEVTRLLRAWSAGDRQALDRLTTIVYGDLHRLAHHYMTREGTGHTLQTTGLINEVFIGLVDTAGVSWHDRAHFFALCAQLMRRVLTDHARARHTVKRGGGVKALNFDESLVVGARPRPDLVALNDALDQLAKLDPRKARVVELRFYGGLSVKDSAEVLKVSPRTVMRDWDLAKAWLWRELRADQQHAAA